MYGKDIIQNCFSVEKSMKSDNNTYAWHLHNSSSEINIMEVWGFVEFFIYMYIQN